MDARQEPLAERGGTGLLPTACGGEQGDARRKQPQLPHDSLNQVGVGHPWQPGKTSICSDHEQTNLHN
jgi:hypothetical protein